MNNYNGLFVLPAQDLAKQVEIILNVDRCYRFGTALEHLAQT